MKIKHTLLTLTGAAVLATCFACREDDAATREAKRTGNYTRQEPGQPLGATGEQRAIPENAIADNTAAEQLREQRAREQRAADELAKKGDPPGMGSARANDNDDMPGSGEYINEGTEVRMKQPNTVAPGGGLGEMQQPERRDVNPGPDRTRTGEMALPGPGGSAGTTGTAKKESPNDGRVNADNEQITPTAGGDGGIALPRDR